MRKWTVVALLSGAVLMGMSLTARAQACAGFTDVLASSSFCPNVEWLKNRGITLGCTSTTLYCPNDPVTRLSMAAFMNRLGKALSPEILFRETGTGAVAIPAAAPVAVRCDTADATVATYPRTVIVNGSMSGLADTNAVAWRGSIVYSTDGGTTWIGTGNVNLRASSAPVQWSETNPIGVIDLQPGIAYRFAIGILRDDQVGGTTGNFTDYRCLLTASVVNRNGTSSPFDVAQTVRPER